MVKRRGFLLGGAAALALPALARAGAIETADVLGLPVSLAAPPERIVLLDATDYLSMAALLPDPAARIVGWASRERLDLGRAATLLPQGIPEVGKLSADTISVESVLALQPDLVVASGYMLPPGGAPLEAQLRAQGIALAWTRGHDDALPPAQGLARTMAFWGAVLQTPERAAALADLGAAEITRVTGCTRALPRRTRCYMEIMSTLDDCCWAAGRAFWGPLFDLAGGALIAGSEGWGAQLAVEAMIAADPEVYIATGGSVAPGLQPGIAPGLDPQTARDGLRAMTGRLALQGSTASRTGRVHGIWSGLALSPVLLPVLVDCLAQWLHPDSCADLDPARTLARINAFFAQPIPGPLWASLRDG